MMIALEFSNKKRSMNLIFMYYRHHHHNQSGDHNYDYNYPPPTPPSVTDNSFTRFQMFFTCRGIRIT
jgi:hypothetical protein